MTWRWRLLPLAVFGLFGGVFVRGLLNPSSTEIPSQWVGHPMPQFNLPAAASSRPGLAFTNLADGHPKIINIFASWCIPCAAEAPMLEQLRQRGVEVDGIALRDRPTDVDAFLVRNGNPYSRIGSDVKSDVAIALGSTGVPETYVIDGQGVIRKQHIGAINPQDIDDLIATLKAWQ